jgi:hypothetical protein
MWATPRGIRSLEKAEATLYNMGVLLLQEQIEDSFEDPSLRYSTRVPIFDKMRPEEQYVCLAFASRGLLSDSKATGQDWHFASVYAVYQILKENLQVEMQMEQQTDIRDQIALAYLQTTKSLGEYDSVINVNHDSLSDWLSRIEVLSDIVVDPCYLTFDKSVKMRATTKAFGNAQIFFEELKRRVL